MKMHADKYSYERLRSLYWENGFSLRGIAEKLGKSRSTVYRWMKEYGIPLREPKPPIKYPKMPFSEDDVEKNYLIGLRAGDLSVKRHYRQIMVSMTTTHSAMIKLVHEVFSKYGRVGSYPAFIPKIRVYEWHVYAYLDKSFEFLLEKIQTIPREALGKEECFLAFLAGYTDAEGSLIINRDRGTVRFTFSIGSEDSGILSYVAERMVDMGYHPLLRLDKEKGEKIASSLGAPELRKHLWKLELCRKDEILRLIQSLPIRHDEKLRKRKLMLELADIKKWPQAEGKVLELSKVIQEEVERCVLAAAVEYQKRHPQYVPPHS